MSSGPAAMVFSVKAAHGRDPELHVPELLGRLGALLVNLTTFPRGCVKRVSTPSVAPISALEAADADRLMATLRAVCSGLLGAVVDMLATVQTSVAVMLLPQRWSSLPCRRCGVR